MRFADFCATVKTTVQELSAAPTHPDATWPGTLLVDRGLRSEPAKRALATIVLPSGGPLQAAQPHE